MIRDILLGIHGLAWSVVVIITAVRTGGQVPPELWAVLPFGVGGIMAAFRADGMISKNRHAEDKT